MTEKESRLTKRNPDGSVGINDFRYYNYEDFQKLANKLAEYEEIGTVEGYERAIGSSIENYNLYREYKAKVQEIRNKAIDEFARRLKYENRQTMSTTVKYSFEEFVDKIAEQMKGGDEI